MQKTHSIKKVLRRQKLFVVKWKKAQRLKWKLIKEKYEALKKLVSKAAKIFFEETAKNLTKRLWEMIFSIVLPKLMKRFVKLIPYIIAIIIQSCFDA